MAGSEESTCLAGPPPRSRRRHQRSDGDAEEGRWRLSVPRIEYRAGVRHQCAGGSAPRLGVRALWLGGCVTRADAHTCGHSSRCGKCGAGARPGEQRTGVTLTVDDVRLGCLRSCTVPHAPAVWCSGVREPCSAGTHSPAVRLFMRSRGRGRRRARCTSQRGRDVSRETVEMARQLRSGVRRPRCHCTPRRVRCSLQGGCLCGCASARGMRNGGFVPVERRSAKTEGKRGAWTR